MYCFVADIKCKKRLLFTSSLFLKEETLLMIKTSQFYQLYSLALPFSEFLSCSVIIPGLLLPAEKRITVIFKAFQHLVLCFKILPFFSPKKSLALYYYTIHRSNYQMKEIAPHSLYIWTATFQGLLSAVSKLQFIGCLG